MQRNKSEPGRLTLQGRPAVFLDKDGTLVEDVPYNVDPERLVFTPHAIEALRLLQQHGYELFIITNQAGMAKGLFANDDIQRLKEYLFNALASQGVILNGFYYCPHHPDGTISRLAVQCACRKPLPGMLLQAAGEHDINLEQSWMIGDILHDVEAGSRAGCKTVLIHNGNETEWQISPWRIPDLVARNLLEAANYMLRSPPSFNPTSNTAYILEKSSYP
jgi:D,D-heptose 1,7-bisphosphate phosphatase